ncbi:MAG: hypothetical protein GY822_30200 [Deltaproteobacteria bacterium]|nr:hypothetical protein [Deltaproteobacteria bacterium]
MDINTEPNKATISFINYDHTDELQATLPVGFFSALLELVGAKDVHTEFLTQPWLHREKALYVCSWNGLR